MTSTLAAAPAQVLAQLAQPTAAYKRRVWLAVASLVLFIILYFLLAGWFLYTAYRLTLGADTGSVGGWLVGLCALFLAVFMVKPLFFVQRGDTTGLLEITAQQQPRLFAFLNELADSAAAPRPHRVFVSPQVNASVFYDLSALNLIFPSRKNLEIGLGLVNALTLGECRAVLAHEFGHFTQSSMAVMRWAYVAQQIAAYLVARRDKLDEFLVGLSRSDFRVAWVGWILGLIVWSIRSLVDTAFRGVVLLQRALSREMEFQADLVAVSLTGSDALIHALHRLQAADDAWDRTMNFVSSQHAQKRIPRDVFTLHARVLERVGVILSDPAYGRVVPVPAERPEQHRVFTPELATPPRMWLTHPLNHEREANAKRRYLAAAIDDRSAWTLFDDPAGLREQMTAVMMAAPGQETVPPEDSLARLGEQFDRRHLSGAYRGVYLGRAVTRDAPAAAALVGDVPRDWREQLDALYPERLIEDVARWRSLEREAGQLHAIQSGALTPADGVIRHRGRTLKHRELPQVIAAVEREEQAIAEHLSSHDRLCRTLHLAAARECGNGWPEYLLGLHQALHYAEHTAANLQDLAGLVGHTVRIVTVTRRVSDAGRRELVAVANTLQAALAEVVRAAGAVTLDPPLAQELGTESWRAFLGKFDLPPADETNIGQWLEVVDGWVGQILNPCLALKRVALEHLLQAEATLAEYARGGATPAAAPAPPSAFPGRYDVLLTGADRPRDAGLSWWQRFQIAEGVIPTVARLAVAAGIVGVVLGFGRMVGNGTITVYNGLSVPVVVNLDGKAWAVGPRASQALTVAPGEGHRIETRSSAGEEVIDSFTVDIPGSFAAFVYNVAGATPLVEWTAAYGTWSPRPERQLGAPRWSRTTADILFDDPPEQVKTSGGGAYRTILTALADVDPSQQLSLVDASDRDHLLRAHARWDATRSRHFILWMANARARLPDFDDILAARLRTTPRDVALLRLEQDGVPPAARAAACTRHQALAAGAPDDPDLSYVAARCIADSLAQTAAFRAGHERWPDNGWFAYAAGYSYVEADQWRPAAAALDVARRALPAVAEYVAVDIARIYRLVEANPRDRLGELSLTSNRLKFFLALESGINVDSGPMLAYPALARGELDRAVKLAGSDSVTGLRVILLAAASDGASDQLVRLALAVAPGAFDDDTRWAGIGLRARRGLDFAPLLDSSDAGRWNYDRKLVTFVRQLQSGVSPATAERLLQHLPPSLRGHGYSVGAVLLGARAPAAWRRNATRLLFATERPHFR